MITEEGIVFKNTYCVLASILFSQLENSVNEKNKRKVLQALIKILKRIKLIYSDCLEIRQKLAQIYVKINDLEMGIKVKNNNEKLFI